MQTMYISRFWGNLISYLFDSRLLNFLHNILYLYTHRLCCAPLEVLEVLEGSLMKLHNSLLLACDDVHCTVCSCTISETVLKLFMKFLR